MIHYRKVVLLVIDGLRPDVIRPDVMPALSQLAAGYWSAARAVTVRPSVTVAALTSLATGVSPGTHGLIEPGLTSLGRLGSLRPLPQELRRHRRAAAVILSDLPGSSRLIARSLLGLAGMGSFVSSGATPLEVADAAQQYLGSSADGFTTIYINDCDRAGHAAGWLSEPYLEAAGQVDRAVRRIGSPAEDTRTLLIVTADHGGGGVLPCDHDEPHPSNDAIPLILAGPGVRSGVRSRRAASLLDIPPTILSALGVPVPGRYEGRTLVAEPEMVLSA